MLRAAPGVYLQLQHTYSCSTAWSFIIRWDLLYSSLRGNSFVCQLVRRLMAMAANRYWDVLMNCIRMNGCMGHLQIQRITFTEPGTVGLRATASFPTGLSLRLCFYSCCSFVSATSDMHIYHRAERQLWIQTWLHSLLLKKLSTGIFRFTAQVQTETLIHAGVFIWLVEQR